MMGSKARQEFAVAAFRRALLSCFPALLFVLLIPRPAAATIAYRVRLGQPERHLFHVEMSVPNFTAGMKVALPAWNALYQIRDFSYRVRDVSAVKMQGDGPLNDPGEKLRAVKLDKQTWELDDSAHTASASTGAKITYSIEWDDPGPFNTQLDLHHAFVNLAQILMYVPDRRSEDTRITFADLPAVWNIVGELTNGPEQASFVAPSYDALVDAPIEAGKFEELQFENDGARFRVVVDGGGWDRDHLQHALREITGYELQLMGGPPFKEYTFFFHIGTYATVGGGGMEHANSTAIAATSMEGAIAIAAHEFFHAWNVKRIRPQSLDPVDYTKEQYTRALWFAEGVTNTYAAYTLERTGLYSKKEFYENLASQIGAVESRPAHEWQSVEESSLDAWLEKYDAYNGPDNSISYYDKGQIIGVLLDLAIRDATDDHKSLDDVLRRMNDEYARQGKFYNDSEGIRAVIEEVSGKSFEDFFRRYVSGTDEIPYNDFLGIAGLELKKDGDEGADSGVGPGTHISIVEIAHPTDRQRRIREGLLRGSTD
jgi:predicted metalloprotease with PDZ domain